MRLAAISPHLDDAVLSVGQVLALHAGSAVITCFAGCPDDHEVATTHDGNCGFTSAGDALATRWREDDRAMAVLDAERHWLDFPDGQYDEPRDVTVIATSVGAGINIVGADTVIGPLGLRHPDHHDAALAFHMAVEARDDLAVWLYEDLPSRVLWPEEVPPRLDWWRNLGWRPTPDELGAGPIEVKAAAVSCYRSQLWALNVHEVLVTERLWRLDRG